MTRQKSDDKFNPAFLLSFFFSRNVTIIYYEDCVYINDIGKRAYVKPH